MYIKLNSDKELVVTQPSSIYVGEHNATVATFFIPKEIGAINCLECVATMNYILPDETYGSIPLEIPVAKDPVDSEGDDISEDIAETSKIQLPYITSELSVGSEITLLSGDVRIWLTFVNDDTGVLMKSGETIIEIKESYIPEVEPPIDEGTPDDLPDDTDDPADNPTDPTPDTPDDPDDPGDDPDDPDDPGDPGDDPDDGSETDDGSTDTGDGEIDDDIITDDTTGGDTDDPSGDPI